MLYIVLLPVSHFLLSYLLTLEFFMASFVSLQISLISNSFEGRLLPGAPPCSFYLCSVSLLLRCERSPAHHLLAYKAG